MGVEWYWDMQSKEIDAVIKGPDGTPYEGGFFRLKMLLPPDYPFKPPKQVKLLTKMWHPNIVRDNVPQLFCCDLCM